MIDRFHITQHLNEAVDEARRKIPKIFLGNLADDKPELENYAEQHPEIVQRLMKLHEEWVKDIAR
jgi:transposase